MRWHLKPRRALQSVPREGISDVGRLGQLRRSAGCPLVGVPAAIADSSPQTRARHRSAYRRGAGSPRSKCLRFGLVLLPAWTVSASLPAEPFASALSVPPHSQGGVTVRFIEVGEFRSSLMQGLEIDVVNESNGSIICDVRLSLQRQEAADNVFREIDGLGRKGVTLPPQARRGFRVSERRTYGRCRVSCDVTVNGRPLCSRRFDFAASGPLRIWTKPYFLLHNAVLVTVEALDPALLNSRFRFRLLDRRTRKTLFETEQYDLVVEKNPNVLNGETRRVQGILSLEGHPPGEYTVVVEMLREQGRSGGSAGI